MSSLKAPPHKTAFSEDFGIHVARKTIREWKELFDGVEGEQERMDLLTKELVCDSDGEPFDNVEGFSDLPHDIAEGVMREMLRIYVPGKPEESPETPTD